MMRGLFTGAEIVEVGDHAGLTRSITEGDIPDLILLDLLFPGFDALRDFAGLRRSLPVTPIVAVSMVHDNRMIDAVMESGANGFVTKTARPDDIAAALNAVMDGETVVLRASGGCAVEQSGGRTGSADQPPALMCCASWRKAFPTRKSRVNWKFHPTRCVFTSRPCCEPCRCQAVPRRHPSPHPVDFPDPPGR